RALTTRGAVEACPSIARCLDDVRQPVRIAALEALAALAGQEHISVIIKFLDVTQNAEERQGAESGLEHIAQRTGAHAAGPMAEGFNQVNLEPRVTLFERLGVAGGHQALQ